MSAKKVTAAEYAAYSRYLPDSILNKLIRGSVCCFSGHRPQKLNIPGSLDKDEIQKRLVDEIANAYSEGYWYFIAGGSTGFDMMAASAVLELKGKSPAKDNDNKIFLEIAVPCLGQSDNWNEGEKKEYERILALSDKVYHVTGKPYKKGCMMTRNKYLVDRSSLIICAFGGISGGTKNTYVYAEKKELRIINLMEGINC